MYCPECGHRNPEQAKFCIACGCQFNNKPAPIARPAAPIPAIVDQNHDLDTDFVDPATGATATPPISLQEADQAEQTRNISPPQPETRPSVIALNPDGPEAGGGRASGAGSYLRITVATILTVLIVEHLEHPLLQGLLGGSRG